MHWLDTKLKSGACQAALRLNILPGIHSRWCVDYELVSNAQESTNCRDAVLLPGVGRRSAGGNQEHGGGGFLREQAVGRPAGGVLRSLLKGAGNGAFLA